MVACSPARLLARLARLLAKLGRTACYGGPRGLEGRRISHGPTDDTLGDETSCHKLPVHDERQHKILPRLALFCTERVVVRLNPRGRICTRSDK